MWSPVHLLGSNISDECVWDPSQWRSGHVNQFIGWFHFQVSQDPAICMPLQDQKRFCWQPLHVHPGPGFREGPLGEHNWTQWDYAISSLRQPTWLFLGVLSIYTFCVANHTCADALAYMHLRLTLVLVLAECVQCCWVLEQPTGSSDTIPYHPRLSWFANHAVFAPLIDHAGFQEYVSQHASIGARCLKD